MFSYSELKHDPFDNDKKNKDVLCFSQPHILPHTLPKESLKSYTITKYDHFGKKIGSIQFKRNTATHQQIRTRIRLPWGYNKGAKKYEPLQPTQQHCFIKGDSFQVGGS